MKPILILSNANSRSVVFTHIISPLLCEKGNILIYFTA
jgi:hypothetical protein